MKNDGLYLKQHHITHHGLIMAVFLSLINQWCHDIISTIQNYLICISLNHFKNLALIIIASDSLYIARLTDHLHGSVMLETLTVTQLVRNSLHLMTAWNFTMCSQSLTLVSALNQTNPVRTCPPNFLNMPINISSAVFHIISTVHFDNISQF